MDQEFAYEQEHLSNAHAKLTQIYERLNQELEREKAAFEKAVADRLDDVTFNFSSDDDVMETLADLEANNLIIDSYGDARTATKDELKRMRLLLRRIHDTGCAKVPVVTNINKLESLRENRMLGLDILAADIYNLATGRNLYRWADQVKMPYVERDE